MRTRATAVALCLMVGGLAVGCGGADDTDETRSAEELLNEANRTMKALESLTIVTSSSKGSFGRLTTDLESRCTFKKTWPWGGKLEQVRIGETDYIRANDEYFMMWGRETVPAMQKWRWLKSPVSAAKGADELADCTWSFSSFGKATKKSSTDLDGRAVIPVKVEVEESQRASYTFYVAAEGRPYVLKVVYRYPYGYHATEFSGFNETLNIQPPAAADVLDLSSLPQPAAR